MALTAAESQKLQETYNLATQVNSNAQKLYEIFSQGGVSNPDLAVLKAELQSEYDSKLNQKFSISGNDIITGHIKGRRNIQLIHRTARADIDPVNQVVENLYFQFLDSASQYTLAAIQHHLAYYGNHYIRLMLRNPDDVTTILSSMPSMGLGYSDTTKCFWGYAPIYTDNLTENSNKIVTMSLLNNLGNTVVHKTGNETIAGEKTFTSALKCTRTNTQANFIFNYTDEPVEHTDTNASVFYVVNTNIGKESKLSHAVYQTYLNTEIRYDIKILNPATSSSPLDVQNMTALRLSYKTQPNKVASCIQCFAEELLTHNIYPMSNNAYDIGNGSYKFANIYASNGTIQTSDENIKTEIQDIPEAVLRAWGKVKFQQFKFKDSVEKKGANARIHMGAIAQRVDKAFKSEGLDARKYGLFCWDEWEDIYNEEIIEISPAEYGDVKVVDSQAMYDTVYNDDDGTETQKLVSPEKSHMERQMIKEAVTKTERKLVKPAGSQYSLRYEQALCLECAYQRWRLEQLEAKLNG